MRIGPHSHPCQHCKTPVECCGSIVQNHDGFPEFTCEEYHQDDGTIAVFLCEECYEADSKEMD